MNSDALAFLAAKGLSLDDIIEFARIAERKADRTNAERQARHRAKKKAAAGGEDITRYSNGVTPSPNDIYSNPQPASTEPDGSAEGARRRKPDPFPCPDGVEPIHWQGLIDNRKKKRAALSAGAHRQIVEKLDGWARDGWPPGPIVAHAAERGWVTVFETDEMKAANGNGYGNNRGGAPQHSGGRGRRDGFQAACADDLAAHQARRSAADGAGDHRGIAAPGTAPL